MGKLHEKWKKRIRAKALHADFRTNTFLHKGFDTRKSLLIISKSTYAELPRFFQSWKDRKCRFPPYDT